MRDWKLLNGPFVSSRKAATLATALSISQPTCARPDARRKRSRYMSRISFTSRALPGSAIMRWRSLTDGQLTPGWALYEFRWLKEPFLSLRPRFPRPVWAGQDLHGKTILLLGEQGFGDIIQFIRYAPLLKRLGATVLLQMRSGLESLAASFPGVDRVFDRDAPLPPFDFHIHLMSLPGVFGTELASIPADIPYLRADSARSDRWAGRLTAAGKLKVGLVWAGNPTHARDRLRSMSLGQLAPLLKIDGARFYSLQKGPAAAQIETLHLSDDDLVNLGPVLDDFSDAAAVLSEMDLVVCVDTAIAHLAGALGKTVWLLVPQFADFRWLEGREDSPWYPTMRLFRQSRRGEWDDVVERVTTALAERVRAGETGVTAPATSRPASPTLPFARPRAEAMAGAPARFQCDSRMSRWNRAVFARRRICRRFAWLVRRVFATAAGPAGPSGSAGRNHPRGRCRDRCACIVSCSERRRVRAFVPV